MGKSINIDLFDIETPNCNQNLDNIIVLNNITQIFNQGTNNEYKLFENFNLNFPKGKIISIMGQSGSGKTQILRLIAGLSTSQKGTITINQSDHSIPMVFQQYSSFPWMTVLDNIALPIKLKGKSWEDSRKKAIVYIKKVGLEQHMYKYAKQPALSGGQLQRISIARCLAENSNIILLDEATGALDIKMKADIDDLILQIHKDNPDTTIINVTHCPEEAVYLSDIVYILQANPCRVFNEKINIIPDISDRKYWKNNPNSNYHTYTNNIIDTLNIICK